MASKIYLSSLSAFAALLYKAVIILLFIQCLWLLFEFHVVWVWGVVFGPSLVVWVSVPFLAQSWLTYFDSSVAVCTVWLLLMVPLVDL